MTTKGLVYGSLRKMANGLFRRNGKIANCNEFRLGIQPQ